MKYLHYLARGIRPKNFYYLSTKSLSTTIRRFNPIHDNKKHLKETMQWLCRAQDSQKDGGVSALFSLFDGWAPSYIETTGYIISTFFNYAEFTKDNEYRKRAIEMADFEMGRQLENGGFEGGRGPKNPVTFNTGQVLFGLCRAYKETKKLQYKEAAVKAGDLLTNSQDERGCFVKNLYMDYVHTYNTRTAWALLELHRISKEQKYLDAAKKNFGWALTQQQDNGWYLHNEFYAGQGPLVHTIAYTIQGLLEAGSYLNEKQFFESARKTAKKMIGLQRADGSLAGTFDKNWKSSVSWTCLTGNAQMSIIWQKIYLKTKEREFSEAAKRANEYLKKTQDLVSNNQGIRGGIAGAYPIYGWYAPFCYINWGAKFFADALMIEEEPKFADKIDS